MPHIHELIDFVVSAFIVHGGRVLLVKHKILKTWLPVGGHIELNEDTDEALFREIQEETGLEKKDLEVVGTKIRHTMDGTKFLYSPIFTDIHSFRALENHRHLAFTYLVKTKTNQVRLCAEEHDEIRWFTLEDLDNPEFALLESISLYARKCLCKIDEIKRALNELALVT